MQGRLMFGKFIQTNNFDVTLPRSGSYIVRVGNSTKRISVK